MKVRVGDVEVRGYHGIAGFAEKWMKRAVSGDRTELHGERWIEVDKTTWRDFGVELAIVRLDDEVWWSAVIPGAVQPPKPAIEWILDHADALTEATSCSFPTWLLHRETINRTGRAS